jgi:hypothetical protein
MENEFVTQKLRKSVLSCVLSLGRINALTYRATGVLGEATHTLKPIATIATAMAHRLIVRHPPATTCGPIISFDTRHRHLHGVNKQMFGAKEQVPGRGLSD